MSELTPTELECQYGWDAPLQYYYLTVTQNDEIIYSNLDDPQALTGTFGGGLTLDQLIQKLALFGVTLNADEIAALRPTATSARPKAIQELLELMNTPKTIESDFD